MEQGHIRTGKAAAGGVLHVELDRADSRNAMTAQMVDSLLAVLAGKEGQAAGAILLYGAGRGFCAGSDLAALAAMDRDAKSRFEADCGTLARAMMAHPRPIVAAAHGFAIGGGLTLAAACDFVVTAPDAKWSLPEVPIGLFPAWGLNAVSLRTGPIFARRLSFGIDMLDGTAAVAAGLADVADANPYEAAADIAERLAALPHEQAASVKAYFTASPMGEDADRLANRLFLNACESAEARASFDKFVR